MKQRFVSALAVTAVAGAGALGIVSLDAQPVEGKTAPSPAVAEVQQLSAAFTEVASSATPAVVFIEVEKNLDQSARGMRGQVPPGMEELLKFFGPGFGPGMPQGQPHPQMPEGPVPFGQGSGFIISKDGYVVTNHHVVGEADIVNVTLSDGREFEAKLIGTDPQTEIALIKIEGDDLPFIDLGNSDALNVGEWVLAIGSPFGLNHTVTSGIVSARGRGNVGIVDYADFIQTDAAINPGNSGGPLLNMDGEVIGMNTAIMSRGGGSNGIGFAIPVNMVKYVVDELRDDGQVSRGFLGVSIQQLTPQLAEWFGVNEGRGVVVADVSEDSPAAKAGLKRDDVIVELNGAPVEEIGAFRSRISTTTAGSDVKLTIVRDGERSEKTVSLGTLPTEELMAKAGKEVSPTENQNLGLAVAAIDAALAQEYGIEGEEGVVVTKVLPGSPAARAGLKPGQLITEVNRQKVENPRAFEKALKEGKHDAALLLVQDGQYAHYVTLEVA
jgi:serine protease Do